MSSTLTSIKTFLGKYYSDIYKATSLTKYQHTNLEKVFEQRFYVNGNKTQVIVDPGMIGLSIIINGNETIISKHLYDHPSITVKNITEPGEQPRGMYSSDTFSTLAYLVSNNQSIFHIVGGVDEPIYIKYKSEYESFYNSTTIFNVTANTDVEIIEEIESHGALNSVLNYIVGVNSRLRLSTFYKSHISSLSFIYRNVITQENSRFEHILFGRGSSNVIDENKIYAYEGSVSDVMGIVDANNKEFHSIITIQPESVNYSVNIDYREIIYNDGSITMYPSVIGQNPSPTSSVSASNINLDEISPDKVRDEINTYIKDVVDRSTLERVNGAARFYDNRVKFFNFP